jgi:hypothetical protein
MIDWRTKDLRNMGMELSLETQESIENYLLRGWAPGGYLESMFAHDYERAFACADTANRQTIWALWRWITEGAPSLCHGSYEAVGMWRDDVGYRRTDYVKGLEQKAIWQKLSTCLAKTCCIVIQTRVYLWNAVCNSYFLKGTFYAFQYRN